MSTEDSLFDLRRSLEIIACKAMTLAHGKKKEWEKDRARERFWRSFNYSEHNKSKNGVREKIWESVRWDGSFGSRDAWSGEGDTRTRQIISFSFLVTYCTEVKVYGRLSICPCRHWVLCTKLVGQVGFEDSQTLHDENKSNTFYTCRWSLIFKPVLSE